jgi:hypothetical protein
MTNIRYLAVLLCAASLSACDKNAVQDITTPITGGAFVRFQNYGVNAPGVNFYANEQKVTAVSSTSCTPPTDPKCSTTGIESATGVAYGGSANGANYEMLAPGQYTLSSRIAALADNGLVISSTSAPLTAGKYYTYFVSGIYNATAKTADAFIIEDNLPTSFDYTKSYIRIVNASVNSPTISASTQLQGATDIVSVATALAYKSASPIVTVAPGLSDVTITIGTITATAKGLNLFAGHVLTLALSGDATATTGANVLTIRAVYNR